MTLDKFLEIFGDAVEQYSFEAQKWAISSTEERKPPLFAQHQDLPTGLREEGEYPFTPMRVVERMIYHPRDRGFIDLQGWMKLLGLSQEDAEDILHAQEGILDTPRRREIRQRLDQFIIDSYEGSYDHVPSVREGVDRTIVYRVKPTRAMFLDQFYEKFKELAGEHEWERVPWPSKHKGIPGTHLFTKLAKGAHFVEDPLTLVARSELTWDQEESLHYSPPIEWASAIGLSWGSSWDLVRAIRGDMFSLECGWVRQRLERIIDQWEPSK